LPECPLCNKEFSSGGQNSYKAHVRREHPEYWAKAKRLSRLATSTLVVSLALTFLLATVFYFPDELGFTVMGVAVLFLAVSSVFALKERGLPGRFRKKPRQHKNRKR
jgi:uncharacterized membrane protein